ncbi:unnamed protein product [Cuscuta campestris]|uniref:SET domain-containing protein n=1 Tax=Cuscuta campestris TaxID=132261 RepID=A0A484LQA5_9ASTE|nr:unnamed protein product [Cuscuta campestris]
MIIQSADLLRNAHKLFVIFPKRKFSARTSIYNVTQEPHSQGPARVPFGIENDDVVSWTWTISDFVKKNQPQKAIGLFKRMLMSNQRPNYVTVLSSIQASSSMGSEMLGMEIHSFAVKMGFESETPIITALLGFYSVWDMGSAFKLFLLAPEKDVILWSATISAFVKAGEYIMAIDLFKEMQLCGVEPNYVSILSVIPACANLSDLRSGRELHGLSIKRSFISHLNVQNSLLDMYAKCGSLNESISIFENIERKDLVSWKNIITGCINNDCPRVALNYFQAMQIYCFEMDERIIREVIGMSSRLDDTKTGQGIHSFALKSGFLECVSVVTSLLQMYATSGNIESARSLFDSLGQKDIIAWSAMISAYAQTYCKLALQWQHKILEKLYMHSHCGLEYEAWNWFHVMEEKYDITPKLAHYACMVDMLSRQGNVEQALEFVNKMPIEPDKRIWGAVLAGCRKTHGSTLPSPPPSTMPTASLTAPSASLISLSPQISLPIKSPPLSFVTAPLTALPSTLPSTSLRHSPAIMDTSGLCLSLRLLRRFQILCLVSGNDGVLDRTGGLMTNHEELLMMVDTREDVVTNEVFERIKEGSRAMAFARRMLSNLNSESPLAGDCDLEEAVLCFVLTNAVEVQDSAGRSVGVAVYGPSFSWNNHGCSPNCSCRFSTMPCSIFASPWCIHPKYTDGDGGNGSEHINTSSNFKFLSSLGSEKECGPRLFVRSIKDIKKGEELLITYTDLLQPKVVRG